MEQNPKLINEKLPELNILRVIATLMIIAFHFVCAIPLSNEYVMIWGRVAVGIFFMISGAGLINSNYYHLDIKEFYLKRFKSIFPAFWICYAFVFAVRYVQYGFTIGTYRVPVQNYIYSFIGVDGYIANFGVQTFPLIGEWFLGAMIIIYLLFPAFRFVFIKTPVITTAIFLLLRIVICRNNPFPIPVCFNLITALSNFSFGALYIILYRKYNGQIRRRLLILGGGIALCVIGELTAHIIEEQDYGEIFATLGLFLCVVSITPLLKRFNSYLTHYILVNSYEIFLIHHFIIAWGADYINANYTVKNVVIGAVVIFSLILINAYWLKASSKYLTCRIQRRYEMVKSQQDKRTKVLLAIFLCLIAYLLIINFLAPIMGEDCALTAIHPFEKVTSVHEFFGKMFAQVKQSATTWNARIGELTSIVFSCFPKVVFDVLNVIVTVGILQLMYRYAYKNWGGWSKNLAHLLSFFISTLVIIILFLPKLGEIFFWRTGSTNYWWSAGLLLLAGLPLREYIGYERLNNLEGSTWKIILFTVLNFAAGFTNENTVCVFIFLYLVTIVYDLVKYKREHVWVIANAIAMTAGFYILLTCPSTRNRVAYYNTVNNITGSFLENAIKRVPDVIGTYFSTNYIIVFLQLLAITVFVITSLIRFKDEHTKTLIEELYKHVDVLGFYIASLLAAAALVGSPYIEPRAYLLCNIFSIICICYYFDLSIRNIKNDNIELIKHRIKIASVVILLVVIVGFCYESLKILGIYRDYHNFAESRNKQMEEAYYGGYQAEWSIYDYANNRELNTREEYLYLQPPVIENYYQIELKR